MDKALGSSCLPLLCIPLPRRLLVTLALACLQVPHPPGSECGQTCGPCLAEGGLSPSLTTALEGTRALFKLSTSRLAAPWLEIQHHFREKIASGFLFRFHMPAVQLTSCEEAQFSRPPEIPLAPANPSSPEAELRRGATPTGV